MVASVKDALWFKMESNHDKKVLHEIDLDEAYKFSEIKCLKYYDGKFYLLVNKLDGVLGYYLFELEADL